MDSFCVGACKRPRE